MARTLSIQRFQSSLETINRAIHAHRTAPFFRHLLDACRSLHDDDQMEIAVYYDDPADPHLFFTIRMQDDAFLLVGAGENDSEPDWVVSEDYLLDVAGNPQKYVEHPEKLSLHWLVDHVNSARK